jgi:hypothetical protein
MKMKALSLWQPWASAMAIGLKKIETRSWSTPYRGLVAIHAAKKESRDLVEFFNAKMLVGRHSQPFHNHRIYSFSMLPLGAVVAIGNLVDCAPVEKLVTDFRVNTLEVKWGNYSQGRFGWVFEDIVKLETPIHIRGMQGLFNVEVSI